MYVIFTLNFKYFSQHENEKDGKVTVNLWEFLSDDDPYSPAAADDYDNIRK